MSFYFFPSTKGNLEKSNQIRRSTRSIHGLFSIFRTYFKSLKYLYSLYSDRLNIKSKKGRRKLSYKLTCRLTERLNIIFINSCFVSFGLSIFDLILYLSCLFSVFKLWTYLKILTLYFGPYFFASCYTISSYSTFKIDFNEKWFIEVKTN